MAPGPAGSGWTTGRIIALAAGSVLLLFSLAFIAGGGTLVWADTEQVHSGYVTTSTATYSTQGYALASDPINVHGLSPFIDKIRIRVTSSDPSRPLFAGIAPTGDVERYLGDVNRGRTRCHRPSGHRGPSGSRRGALGRAGRGHRERDPRLGGPGRRRTVVVMDAGGRPGLSVRAETGISVPALPLLAGELLGVGMLTGVVAGAMIVVPVRLASRR